MPKVIRSLSTALPDGTLVSYVLGSTDNDVLCDNGSITLKDKLAQLDPPDPSGVSHGDLFHLFSELDDIQICCGTLTNAGAGWNSATFPKAFDGVPSVVATVIATECIVIINNVTAIGFQYQLRVPGVSLTLTPTSGTYYTAAGAAATSTHSAVSLISGISGSSSYVSATTASAIKLNYQAIYDGGV